jgi:starch synthase
MRGDVAKILSVVSELYPLVKTGGLADVAGALPKALEAHGFAVATLVPGYPSVMAALKDATEVFTSADCFGGSARVLAAQPAGLNVLVLDAPHLFERAGTPYAQPDGADWPDNALRFGALSLMAARIGLGEMAAFKPDILHAHDWQAALTMAYLEYDGRLRPATVLTVHNLAFQGQFPKELLETLRLPGRAYAIDGVEFYGAIGFLKAGLQFADRITTVSPTYAKEIQTPEWGCGVDALLRARASVLSGILNGIDVSVWDPASDPLIPARYDRSTVAARKTNKAALQSRLGLHVESDRLLFGMVGRFAWQKGLDLLADAVPALLDAGAGLALLGRGDHDLEQRFISLTKQHPGRIACALGHDESLAHLMQAGVDALIVPSRFEPCGLTQLCALRYGSVPVVARVGGLIDTVVDVDEADALGGAATGLKFAPGTSVALAAALRRTAQVWSDRGAWVALQANGMAVDVSWSQSAACYAELYRSLLAAKK